MPMSDELAAVADRLDAARSLCRRLNVRRMGLLHEGLKVPLQRPDGSWSRPEDLLHVGVEFGDPPGGDLLEQYFGTMEGLDEVLGRPTLMADLRASKSESRRAFNESKLEVFYDARDDKAAA